jgi:hypothetical protein
VQDKNPDTKEAAAAKFKEISEAYEVRRARARGEGLVAGPLAAEACTSPIAHCRGGGQDVACHLAMHTCTPAGADRP